MWRKVNPSVLLVGGQTGAATMENLWTALKKLKMQLPYDPAIPFLGIYPKKPKTLMLRNMCTLLFTAVLFSIAKTQSNPSTHQWTSG